MHPAVLAITTAVMVVLLLVGEDPTTWFFVLAVGPASVCPSVLVAPALQNYIAYSEAWLLLTNEAGGLAHLIAIRKETPHTTTRNCWRARP